MRKILPHIFIFAFIFMSFLAFTAPAHAAGDALDANVHGYAWNGIDTNGNSTFDDGVDGGIGWISLNCAEGGAGGTNVCAQSLYGVNLSNNGQGIGNFSGHAWAPTVGWISFDAADVANCPVVDTNDADNFTGCVGHVVRNPGEITGWARIVSPPATGDSGNGNWNGWIHLSSASNSPFLSPTSSGNGGLTYKSTSASLVGYAYAGTIYDTAPAGTEEFGWIDFCYPIGFSGNSECASVNESTPTSTLTLSSNTATVSNIGYTVNLTWTSANSQDLHGCTPTLSPLSPNDWLNSANTYTPTHTFLDNSDTFTASQTGVVVPRSPTSQYQISCLDSASHQVDSNIVTVTVSGVSSNFPSVNVTAAGICLDNNHATTDPGQATLSWNIQNVSNLSACTSGIYNSGFVQTDWAGSTISSATGSATITVNSSSTTAPPGRYAIKCGITIGYDTISQEPAAQCTASTACSAAQQNDTSDPSCYCPTHPSDPICLSFCQANPNLCVTKHHFLWFEY